MADGLELGRTLVSVIHAPRTPASLAPFPLSLYPISPSPSQNPIIRSPPLETLRLALRAFEKRMMRRVSVEMRGARENLQICFGPEPAKRFRNQFYWIMAKSITEAIIYAPINLIQGIWSEDKRMAEFDASV